VIPNTAVNLQLVVRPPMRGTIPAEVKPDATPAAAGSTTPSSVPVSGLVPSGIRPLDYRLGGILPNRPYVISGNPGTGKSVSCLEFAQQGLEGGETVVLITHDDPADVLASAAFLGIDIERPLREERLILLRFQLDFVRRLGRATTADAVFTELRRHFGTFKIGRVAIDSIVPFLDGGAASTTAIYGLIQFLDELQVTSLLTFPGDMAGLYDRRLEPLMQRSAGVFHLSSDSERNHKLEVRKIRFDAASMLPVTFRILSGAGMVVITDADSGKVAVLPEEAQHRLALVNMADPLPNELVNGLRHHFEVDVRTGMLSAFSEVVRNGVGALLLNVRRDVIESALQLIRDLRQTNNTVPVVLITPYVLRSADRTRALRAGADDFLSTSLAPTELTARLQTIVKRGHWHDLITTAPEPGMILQPTSDGSSYMPMSGDALTKCVRGYLDRDQLPFFTLFLISPEKGETNGLAKMVLNIVRVESGDLVGVLGKRVIAYLDSARPKDLASLKIRMREHALRLGYGDIEIEALGFPANEDVVRDLLGAPAAS
jgi:KaiC/GvpD/RAD55 family RecA-like ATPase/ActR/RegA family two-component response regulator